MDNEKEALRAEMARKIQEGLDKIIVKLPSQKLFSDGSKETFTYDVMGNVPTQANSSGTVQNQYDLLGRLAKQTDVFGNVLTYTYEHLEDGLLPHRWMSQQIAPIYSWGGFDVDYEWQIPAVEYWLLQHGYTYAEEAREPLGNITKGEHS